VTAFWIAAVLILLIGIALYCATVYMYRFAMIRSPERPPDPWTLQPDAVPPPEKEPGPDELKMYLWERKQALRAVYAARGRVYEITSSDGLRLCARFIPPEGEMRGIYLMVHGYRSTGFGDFCGAAQDMLRDRFGCFIIDQRAHGASEGDTITFGVRERYDVLQWAQLLLREFPDMPVILDGISMGAATVMGAAALELPPNVRAIIADCGYTSMRGIFDKVIRQWFHLPPFPMVHLAELYCRAKNGFGFSDLDSAACLAEAKVPVLLAHGTADGFVPYTMAEEIYAAVRDRIDIEFVSAEGAEHGFSYLIDYDGYYAAICRLYAKIFTEENAS